MAQPRLLVCALLAVAASASPMRMKSSVIECDAHEAMIGVATTHLTTTMKASDITCMPYHAPARPDATNLTCDQPFAFVQSISYQARLASVCICYDFDMCLTLSHASMDTSYNLVMPGYGCAHQAGVADGCRALDVHGMQRIRRQATHGTTRRGPRRDRRLSARPLCSCSPPLRKGCGGRHAHRVWFVFGILQQHFWVKPVSTTDVSLAVDCTEEAFDTSRFDAQADWLQATFASTEQNNPPLDTTPRMVVGAFEKSVFSLSSSPRCVGLPCDDSCSECNHLAHRCMRCTSGYYLPPSATSCGTFCSFFPL